MTFPLFGRSAEVARLHEVLAGVSAGTAALAHIEGEPGIGKSALLAEVTARARGLGFRVFSGRAEELEQNRPFRALYEALRAGKDRRREEIARLLGSGSGEEGVFYRLVDAFEDVVEAEALQGPVLLTVDDLQWADAGTVRAIAGIARRMGPLPVVMVATLRREPRSEELAALLRSTSSQALRISLQPLDESAVAEMVAARLGAVPGPKLRAHVGGAGGNPFYVAELLDALQVEAAIQVGERSVEIEKPELPPSLVLTVLRRLSALPPASLDVLRSAAVLGSSFMVDELATAAGVSTADALAAVQTLRSHEVLVDEGEKVRFRHDIIREALYEDLGGPVRVSMHRRIGLALAAAGAAPLEVAGHLSRGAARGDTEAAEWMIQAAADPALDSRTMAGLIERALEINPAHSRRSSLVYRLTGLLTWQGRPAEAIPHLERLLPDVSDVSERLHLISRLVGAYFHSGSAREAEPWIAHGSVLARQLEDSDRPEVLLAKSIALFNEGDLEGAVDFADRAAAVVRESGSATEGSANDQASWLLTLLGRSDEAVARSERAVALPTLAAGAKSLLWRHLAWALGDLDRIDEAESALAVARTIAEDKGLPMLMQSIIMESGHLRYSTGRFDEAVTDAETAAGMLDEFDSAGEGPHPRWIIAWVAHHRLDDAAVERPSTAGPTVHPGERLWPTLLAARDLDRGHVDEAGDRARELLVRIAGNGPRQRRDYDVLPVLARICMEAGDNDSARLGRDTATRLAEGSNSPGVRLAAERCLAIVDRDAAAARRAVELARSSPRILLAAETFEDAATVLDGDEAVEILREALKLYEVMGSPRGESRIAVRLRELGARAVISPARARPVSGWEALTPSELEVVRLAARGLTNREIGSHLFVSHHTVATHLSHVFDKLALRSRVELAREAASRFGGAEAATG